MEIQDTLGVKSTEREALLSPRNQRVLGLPMSGVWQSRDYNSWRGLENIEGNLAHITSTAWGWQPCASHVASCHRITPKPVGLVYVARRGADTFYPPPSRSRGVTLSERLRPAIGSR